MRRSVPVAAVGAIFLCVLAGWFLAGYLGVALGLVLGAVLFAIPWYRQTLCSWAFLYLSRGRPIRLADVVTATNDGAPGAIRCQDGFAVAAVHVLGKAHKATLLTGTTAATVNTLDLQRLLPMMHQSLGLTIGTLSVVSVGSRRCGTGDYPRVYDTLIGNTPCAGQRETWLILRINLLENGEALRCRSSAGVATLAAAQRIAAELKINGVRTKVATSADIAGLERRLGSAALETGTVGWHSLRTDTGWMTTYAYRPGEITAEALGRAWSLRVDGVVQNITLFPDGTTSATVTTRTPQPPPTSPSTALQTLPGQQAQALLSNLCGPPIALRGVARGSLRVPLTIPVGQSGVLLGTAAGGRLLQPLTDPGRLSRVAIRAEDRIAKRIIARTAATGERITVHTKDLERWNSVRMPTVVVTDKPQPAPGTTVSVVDGTVSPGPRPSTVISVEPQGGGAAQANDVVIDQTGPMTIEVTTADSVHGVTVEMFRAENRYAGSWHNHVAGVEFQTVE